MSDKLSSRCAQTLHALRMLRSRGMDWQRRQHLSIRSCSASWRMLPVPDWIDIPRRLTNTVLRRLSAVLFGLVCLPLPSDIHHRSNGDCLEGKGENYQVCSVQYCSQQLCTVQCTHIWTDLTVLWIGFCLNGPISLCLDSFLCMYVLSVWLYVAYMCSIV